MKAVIAIQWHQYIVAQGDELVVDQLEGERGDKVDFSTVLLTFDDEGKQVAIGTPYLEKVSVTTKIVEQKKGDKVKVFKFQGKKRYHKTRGFRPSQTILFIEKINA